MSAEQNRREWKRKKRNEGQWMEWIRRKDGKEINQSQRDKREMEKVNGMKRERENLHGGEAMAYC